MKKNLIVMATLMPLFVNAQKITYKLIIKDKGPIVQLTKLSGDSKEVYDLKATLLESSLYDARTKENDQCAFVEIPEHLSSAVGSPSVIVCSSGKLYKKLGVTEGSSTGTPPNLMYKNYIGHYNVPHEGPMMPGAGRRITYCNGPCKATNK